MDRSFSDCSKDRSLELQTARFTGVGRELTSKWFSFQTLFFLSLLISFVLYINNLFGCLLSHVLQFVLVYFLDSNKGNEPAVAWRTPKCLGMINIFGSQTVCLYKRISSSLVFLSNNSVCIEVLLNPW